MKMATNGNGNYWKWQLMEMATIEMETNGWQLMHVACYNSIISNIIQFILHYCQPVSGKFKLSSLYG